MNYSEGKIYKLFITGLDEVCYIGSTTSTLSERLCMHRHQSKNDNQNKCASSVFFEEENDVQIQLLEDYPCESKQQLEVRERYWIEQYQENINKNIPTRGWKERWIQNREHNLAKHREWIEAHKEQQAAYKKAKREANLEAARQKDRECRERRKEAANAHKKEKVECPECKKIMNRNSLSDHKKRCHS